MFAKTDAVETRQKKEARKVAIALWVAVVGVAAVAFALTTWGILPTDHASDFAGAQTPVEDYHWNLLLRVAGLTFISFVPVWVVGLQDRGFPQILGAALLIALAGFGGGYLALVGKVLPAHEDRQVISLTVGIHRDANQSILDRYSEDLRRIGAEDRLSAYQVEVAGLAPARAAIPESAKVVVESRKAYAATLAQAQADMKVWSIPPELRRTGSLAIERNHASVARYWELQGQYPTILRDMLTVLERRSWRIGERGYVFSSKADEAAWDKAGQRLKALSAAIDQDIATRKPAKDARR